MTKLMSADAAAALVPDGATVLVDGSGGGVNEPGLVLAALESRFVRERHPSALTVVHPSGVGDGQGAGIDRFAHPGMVAKVIGGHWNWAPRMQRMASAEEIAAYCLPQGVLSHLFRAIAGKAPGVITHIGLGTFVDPRLSGGRLNARAEESMVELMTIKGREYLFYPSFPIDVAVIRGTTADELTATSRWRARACMPRRCRRRRRRATAAASSSPRSSTWCAPGTLDPRVVKVPGVLVDAVVVDPGQRLSVATERGPEPDRRAARAGDGHRAAAPGRAQGHRAPRRRRAAPRRRGQPRLRHARRGRGRARRGRPGRPGDVHGRAGPHRRRARRRHRLRHGAQPDGDASTRAPSSTGTTAAASTSPSSSSPRSIRKATSTSASSAARIAGIGGFVNISQGARRVVFVGTLRAGKQQLDFAGKGLRIVQEGKAAKFVPTLEQISFSGEYARRWKVPVTYVTERAVFRLEEDGLVLTEIAPGLDLERDVLAQMGFRPRVAAVLKTMDARLFANPAMGLQLAAGGRTRAPR